MVAAAAWVKNHTVHANIQTDHTLTMMFTSLWPFFGRKRGFRPKTQEKIDVSANQLHVVSGPGHIKVIISQIAAAHMR
eukprot:1158426-Pelagomonas_calceolata.AAC.18